MKDKDLDNTKFIRYLYVTGDNLILEFFKGDRDRLLFRYVGESDTIGNTKLYYSACIVISSIQSVNTIRDTLNIVEESLKHKESPLYQWAMKKISNYK
jgi:hypothetical protein